MIRTYVNIFMALLVGVFSVIMLLLVARDSVYLNEYIKSNPEYAAIFLAFIAIIVFSATMISIFFRGGSKYFLDITQEGNSSADTLVREFQRSIENTEQRIRHEFEEKLLRIQAGDADLTKDVKDFVNENLTAQWLENLDEMLRARVLAEGKASRMDKLVSSVTEEMKLRVEAPAGRAEEAAKYARRAAYFFTVLGLLIALARVLWIGDAAQFANELAEHSRKGGLWPVVVAIGAPWLGLIVLVEFTALLMFRMSARATQLQTHFTESLAELRDRHLAMRIALEFGKPEDIVQVAKALFVQNHNAFTEESDADSVSAAAKLTDSVTGLIKEASSKLSGGK